MICGKCGQEHVSANGGRPCMGHANVRDDQDRIVGTRPCRKNAMTGQTKCYKHGGSSPQAKRAAARRETERKAAAILRRFGEPIDTTPTEALLDAVKWTAGYVAWLRDKVAAVDSDDDLVWGQTRNKVGGDDRGQTFESGKNAWLALLGEWHDRLVRICAEAIKAGIEERRVQIAEQQGALVADVIRKILNRLNLTPEQAATAGEVVPLELRRLAG